MLVLLCCVLADLVRTLMNTLLEVAADILVKNTVFM